MPGFGRNAGQGSSTARGYGTEHRKARTQALAQLAEAGWGWCARGTTCLHADRRIYPGQQLELDHTDDRQAYRGLAHADCNRKAGAVKGARRAAQAKRRNAGVTRTSRDW